MKNVVLIFIAVITLPCVSLAQGITGTSYPTNRSTYYGQNTNGNSYSSTSFGYYANAAGSSSTSIGAHAGRSSSGSSNTFLGGSSGYGTVGNVNLGIGVSAVEFSIGSGNAFLGLYSGAYSEGSHNTGVGGSAGEGIVGAGNVYLGQFSGAYCSGNDNTFIGCEAGYGAYGSSNVFLGRSVGSGKNVNNRLFIDNTSTSTPLIFGKFDTDQVGINTTNIPTGYAFAVKGSIITQEVKVKLYATGWPDYVFNKDYNLPSLKDVEQHIKEKGHLQNMPSAEEVAEDGILLGDMNAKLLQKIEELTLYTIQQQKELEEQKGKNSSLESRLKKLEQLLSKK